MQFFILLAVFVTLAKGQVVDTQYGKVSGHLVSLADGTGINSFIGIPFAKPPVGNLRWQPPVSPDPWSGVLEARNWTKMCPQSPLPPGQFIFTHPATDDSDISEDCLYLNVYAPNKTTGAPFPVMVWVHGGGYTGSGSMSYPGHFLAAKDVVVVTTNYRIGHLGFMSTADRNGVGNYGLRDQHKAFEFVRDNIRNFGGDPNKVTCFGQSAGAGSCGLHTVAPSSRGLFHQVILQSGSELSFWAVQHPACYPQNYTKQVATQLNCTTDDTAAMMDCMRQVDYRTVIDQSINCSRGCFCMGFAPVVDNNTDGSGGFLPKIPQVARWENDVANVKLMTGLTSEDGSLYVLALIPEFLESNVTVSREWFLELIKTRFIEIFRGGALPEHRVNDVFQAYNWFYSPWPEVMNNSEGNKQKLNEIVTDAAFGLPTDMTIKYHSSGVNEDTYYYRFAYRSSNFTEVIPNWMGVPHIADLPFTLGFPLLETNPQVRDDMTPREDNPFIDFIDWNDEDRQYADFSMTLWTNFAKFGNPTPTPVQPPANNQPTTWGRYEKDDYNYIEIDREVKSLKNYRQQNHAFYLHYLLYMSGLTEANFTSTTV